MAASYFIEPVPVPVSALALRLPSFAAERNSRYAFVSAPPGLSLSTPPKKVFFSGFLIAAGNGWYGESRGLLIVGMN